MSFTRLFLLGPVFFRTALPCSGGYHPERGEMPLHDAVGINRKNGATTENQITKMAQLLKIKSQKWRNYWKSRHRGQVYGLRGVCLMIVCVIWLDMTTPPWWREKVMVYYYHLLHKQWLVKSFLNYTCRFITWVSKLGYCYNKHLAHQSDILMYIFLHKCYSLYQF